MSDVKPALSPEQWERVLEHVEKKMDWYSAWHDGEVMVEFRDPHALAAACLHGQPFGFSWEDVDDIRESAGPKPGSRGYSVPRESTDFLRDAQAILLHDIADRITALLPPREEP